mmetsp:Transcript_30175/g.101721  ORF Transcript_30175/g.101721 Transcript_30175/m.101721 type:complete len:139 (-) Transcript_30175:36-452(-)
MISTLATAMEAAVECTFPAPPELSTGLLFCGGNVFTVGATYVYQWILRLERHACTPLELLRPASLGKAPLACFTLAATFVYVGLCLTYNGPYRRLAAERPDADAATGAVAADQRSQLCAPAVLAVEADASRGRSAVLL